MKVLSIIPPSTPCLTILITVRHFFARNTFLLKNNWECISVVKTVIFRRQISFETIYVNLLTKALTHKKLLANISASNKHRLLSMSWLKKYFQSETCAEVGDASLLNVLFLKAHGCPCWTSCKGKLMCFIQSWGKESFHKILCSLVKNWERLMIP